MARLKDFAEVHERPWCPAVLRDGVTDFLSFFSVFSGLQAAVCKCLAALLKKNGKDRLVELCAGSGFSGLNLIRTISGMYPGKPLKLLLTDLYPNANWPEVCRLESKVECVPESCDAHTALKTYDGVFFMFAALHHFSEREIVEMLATAIQHRRSFLSVDYFQRGRLIEFLLIPAGAFLEYCIAFLIFPFSWMRLLFTYVIPLIPLVLMADTLLSQWRSYSVDELNALIQKNFPDHADLVKVEILPLWKGIAHFQVLTLDFSE